MRNGLLRTSFWCFAMLAGLLFSGCGYHLRGAVMLPEALQKTALRTVNADSALAGDLRRQLSASGVQVLDRVRPGVAVLDITRDLFERRVLTVGSSGKAQEYEVHYSVAFQVTGPDGKPYMAPQEMHLSRDFVFDELDVLGKANEEALVQRTLQKDMARLLLMRLQAQGK